MTELRSHHRAVALLVEDAQALHKVLEGALVLVLSDGLEHGQELLKVQHLVIQLWDGEKNRIGKVRRTGVTAAHVTSQASVLIRAAGNIQFTDPHISQGEGGACSGLLPGATSSDVAVTHVRS